MHVRTVLAAAAALAAAACSSGSDAVTHAPEAGETHFRNLTQITFGGENAEAYFSADGSKLIFQSTRDGRSCDQQFVMDIAGHDLKRVSTGTGKTTCGYFFDNDSKVLFASTHVVDSLCPPRPDYSRGYVWRLDDFDIFTANADGSGIARLTSNGIYTAEATVSRDGRKVVFTSLKDGDLEIYTMNIDGSDVRRLTHTPGYDGGPFFSPDGSKIIYRAYHPSDSTTLAEYQQLLTEKLVRPSAMELWVMDADGSNQRQITTLGGANFAPFFTPDGEHVIFASNHRDPTGRDFDLYLIGLDGSGLEQVTHHEAFDAFPMFSPDGKLLVWASNRHAAAEGETNIFIAEWVQ